MRADGLAALWPDLAKLRHFGKMLKVFGQFLEGLINICHNFEPILAHFMLLGQFWLLQMAKFWKISLAIWSHCLADALRKPGYQNHWEQSRVEWGGREKFVRHRE